MALWAHSTSSIRWSSLRSSPSVIRCTLRISFRTDPVPYFINFLQEDLTSLGQWEANWQMKFNVAKCHSVRVTWHQHHKQILFDYSLHNQTLENVQSAKYLGITNKTLVRPKLEYAAPIWSPYSKLQINQVEKVQRTAACWTCRRWGNTSSVG